MTITGVNQLWVADITQIRPRTEFVYLAVILDRFSRKAIGWALDRTLAARVTVTALRHAIARRPPPGVVHHSDRGVQYACAGYVEELKTNGMVPSMSRPANPHDNAFRESFVKTLKQEEIYCNQYRDFDELSAHLEEFIGNYHNRPRLHSALGYRAPEEFEQAAAAATSPGGTPGAAAMKYFTPPRAEGSVTGSRDPNRDELAK
jgi:transposase InsO family protein